MQEEDVPEQGVPEPVILITPPDAEEETHAPVPPKPRKKLADIFAIKRFTTSEEVEVIPVHQVASSVPSFATTNSGTSTDDSALTSGPPTRTVSWDREGICSDAEAEHAGDAGKAEDGKHKKRRKIFKKLGKKVKKAFEPLTHSRASSPKKA
ncbi:hypothetical protein COCOBI_17-0780 [Coccomyxa sp. Obi]|nr:hypothetical protein COCOBI_17-0780 [Coccomyxa sp. Obi]